MAGKLKHIKRSRKTRFLKYPIFRSKDKAFHPRDQFGNLIVKAKERRGLEWLT